MHRRRNPLKGALAAVFTLAFIHLTRLLPVSWNRVIALSGGRILARLVPRVRGVAMANLNLAYGDSLSREEKEAIYRGVVDNVCLVAAEFGQIARLVRAKEPDSVKIVGAELIEKGQGYLCIGAHMGNWELMGPAMVALGFKVSVVVRPFDDPRVDRLIDGVRREGGTTTVPKENAGREILNLLGEGQLVGILIDQSPRENGVPVTSFGAPCWATIAPVMIAVRAKVPMVPVALTRNPDRGYTLRFYPPISMVRTGNLRDDLLNYAQVCQDAIDRIIKDNPSQWLWLHRRWKERPLLAEEWARKMHKERKETR